MTEANMAGYTAPLKEYGEQAIQCCIDSWNRLCPQYPLTNVTAAKRRKRWSFVGPDVVTLEQAGDCGQISRITFGINGYASRSALRKRAEPPKITVNCWIHWNCEITRVRGWSDRIVVDIEKDCVVQFPNVVPMTPHIHWHPTQ